MSYIEQAETRHTRGTGPRGRPTTRRRSTGHPIKR
nr:MAG TPA: hypothetical protein [Caudoviricetes sp.]DAY28865.1 MAG TPA: hypothetical protein [Caudoviricetes sp.]